MAYMNQEKKKIIAEKLKPILKKYGVKGTLSVQNHMSITLKIKEGKVDVLVHDWTLLDSTNQNYFMLDTMNYVPREYNVEIKARVNGEEIHYHETIKFEILSEK